MKDTACHTLDVDLISLHRDLCAQVDDFRIIEPSHPNSLINLSDEDQADIYHLTPPFRALVLRIDTIDFDTNTRDLNPHTSTVRFIRTGDEDHMSGTIDVASISDIADQQHHNCTSVVTSLDKAITCILELVQRERNASGQQPRTLDKRLDPGMLAEINQLALVEGYTGQPLQELCTVWVEGNFTHEKHASYTVAERLSAARHIALVY